MGCSASIENDAYNLSTISFLGLDGAGKSEIIFRLMSDSDSANYIPIPTAVANNYKCSIDSANLNIFDVGGLGVYRSLWKNYINISDGIVFVIDRTDHARLGCVREELSEIFSEINSKGIPILICINKSDVSCTPTSDEIKNAIRIQKCTTDLLVIDCSAKTISGLEPGREWLLSHFGEKTEEEQENPEEEEGDEEESERNCSNH